MTRPYRVTAKIQNNRLWSAIIATYPQVKNQSQAAACLGVGPMVLSGYLNLRHWPYGRRGGFGRGNGWTETAKRVATALKETPEFLFDGALYGRPIAPAVFEVDLTERQLSDVGMLALPPSPSDAIEAAERHLALESAIDGLPTSEREVLRRRFGFNGDEETLEETGRHLARPVTTERVRQIEAKALRKLRHPSRAKLLREHV